METNIKFARSGRDEVLGKLMSSPIYSTFGVGFYGEVGKMLSLVLDNSTFPMEEATVDRLMQILEKGTVKHLHELLRLKFSEN
jgi:alanine dehydrogenase